jgi:hypothetical protein
MFEKITDEEYKEFICINNCNNYRKILKIICENIHMYIMRNYLFYIG